MSIGWRIWFALLIVAALYGLTLIGDAREAAELNESQVQVAQQQTVVGLWQVADLATILIYELIVVVVAIASIGLLLVSRDEASPEDEMTVSSRRGAHVERPTSEEPLRDGRKIRSSWPRRRRDHPPSPPKRSRPG